MSEAREGLKDLVTLEDVTVVKETKNAFLISNGDREEWIPKSLVGRTSEVEREGDTGMIRIPEWLAKDRGLI
jgi:RNase P/RNase MRP subunit p29